MIHSASTVRPVVIIIFIWKLLLFYVILKSEDGRTDNIYVTTVITTGREYIGRINNNRLN